MDIPEYSRISLDIHGYLGLECENQLGPARVGEGGVGWTAPKTSDH